MTNHRARQFGTSKYGISRTTRVILDLLTVKYFIQYAVSPMKLFGMIGLILGALAGYYLGAHYAQRISQQRVRQIITVIGFVISAVTFYKEFLTAPK